MSVLRRPLLLLTGVFALGTVLGVVSAARAGDGGPAGIVQPPPPAGDIVFVSDRFGDSDIFTMTDTGAGQTRRTTEGGFQPEWSPDGEQIAFTTDRDGNFEIYVMDADGENQTNLTEHPGRDASPAWSPGGDKIVFATNRDGDDEIYIMDADGDNQVNLTNDSADDRSPSFSPDGSQITFERGVAIWTMDPDGGNQELLVEVGQSVEGPPTWKPDGSRIIFSVFPAFEIWAVDPDGSNLESLFEGLFPAWSPDGERIVFVRDSEIRTANEDGGSQQQLTDNDDLDGSPHWKPSGEVPTPTSTPDEPTDTPPPSDTPQPTDTPPAPTNTPEPTDTPLAPTSTPAPEGQLGDVNCDGMVNAIDAAVLLQLLAALLNELPCPDNADVNENGDVDAVDAALILQFGAGLIDSLPP